MNTIDIGRAIKAPFTDKEWVTKTLLGFVWLILVVTIPAVFGAQIEYIKRSAQGRDELPDWSGFGDKWVRGFLAGVAGFIYFLPLVVGGVLLIVPLVLSSVFGTQSDAPIAIAVLIPFVFLMFVYALAVTLFFYAALTHYAMTERFGAFFEFGEISRRLRTGGYFTSWLLAWVVSLVASAVSSMLTATYIGGILTPAVSFLSMMMMANLFGQYASGAYGVVPVTAPSTAPPAYAPPTAPPPPTAYAPPAAPAPPTYAPPTPPSPATYEPPAPPPPVQAPAEPPPPAEPPSAPGDDA